MIAKYVPTRSLGKSDFAGLVNYVTDAAKQEGETPGQEGARSLTLAPVTAFAYDCCHGQQMRGFESWQS